MFDNENFVTLGDKLKRVKKELLIIVKINIYNKRDNSKYFCFCLLSINNRILLS